MDAMRPARVAALRLALQGALMSLRAVVHCATRSERGVAPLSPWVAQADLASERLRTLRYRALAIPDDPAAKVSAAFVERLEREFAETRRTSGSARQEAVRALALALTDVGTEVATLPPTHGPYGVLGY